MKSLQQILKANGQVPNQVYQKGELTFDKKAGCLVYNPPGIRDRDKEVMQIQKAS
jgi:hypothetical protein